MNEGTVVDDRFEIVKLAGSGGMGTVYRAHDRQTGGDVALKVLTSAGEVDRARFDREAKVLADLEHPAIVRHVAAGEGYLAMEWVEGVDLATCIARRRLAIAETLALGRALAEALGAAHAKGIVHRDMKPSNVLLVTGDPTRPKLADFGIARTANASALTRTGQVVGTPAYMAPELLRSRAAIDARVDIFALGCVLYESLTGERAFDGEDMRVILAKVLFTEATSIATLRGDAPAALIALVEAMMQKDPALRPQSCEAIVEKLAAITEDDPPTAAPIVRAPSDNVQRWVHVIVATPSQVAVVSADTETPESQRGDRLRLQSLVNEYGGELEVVADGTIFVVLRGAGQASDRAATAARCALALAALVPDARVALSAARAMTTNASLSDIFTRAVALTGAPGVVRIDEHVAALLDPRFVASRRDDGAIELSHEEPIARRPRVLLGQPTPTVGRDRELASLKAMLAEVANDRVARAVLITADAGVGKSRLRQEVVDAASDFDVWIARGEAMSAGSPLLLAAQLVREAGGRRRDLLEAAVARLVAEKDRASVVAFLAETVGLANEGDAPLLEAARRDPLVMAERMRVAWEMFIVGACSARPVLVVLEDLHWGDLPSIKLVDAALRRCRDRPLAVLALARPEVSKTFPDLWSERAIEHVRLPSLSPRACGALVRHALGQVEDEVVARIVDLCAGNALYLEELIRATREGADRLPSTVLAMVQARLEALEPPLQRALQLGSIFGEVVPIEGVRALGVAEIDVLVGRLVELELLEAPENDERPSARFRHALVREAIYDSLSAAERADRHQQAARWLESSANADPVVLAEHYERAGDRDKAIHHFRNAARRLYRAGDSARSADVAARALALGPDEEAAGHLHLVRAAALWWVSSTRDAAEAALQGIKGAPVGSKRWYRGVIALIAPLVQSGQLDKCLPYVEELQRLEPTFETGVLYARAHVGTSLELAHVGRVDLSSSLMDRVDVIAKAINEPSLTAWTLSVRAWIATFTGRPAEGRGIAQRAADTFEELVDPQATVWARCVEAMCSLQLGLWSRVVALVEKRMELSLFEPPWGFIEQGEQLARKDFEAATRTAERTIAVARSTHNTMMLPLAKRCLAHALVAKGRVVEASQLIEEALPELTAFPPHLTNTQAVEAVVALVKGDHARAVDRAQKVIDAIERRCIWSADLRAYLVRAAAHARAGDAAAAVEALRRGRAMLEDRSSAMSDADRTSFLRGIPAHARILDLADDPRAAEILVAEHVY